jgi:hypothetical protein
MSAVGSRVVSSWLIITMVLVLSVMAGWLTSCAHYAGITELPHTQGVTHETLTIINSTMFNLDWVIVSKVGKAPFYMRKHLKFAGWVGPDMLTNLKIEPGKYWFVFKIGYIDNVLIHEFIVRQGKPQTISIMDVNKKYKCEGGYNEWEKG